MIVNYTTIERKYIYKHSILFSMFTLSDGLFSNLSVVNLFFQSNYMLKNVTYKLFFSKNTSLTYGLSMCIMIKNTKGFIEIINLTNLCFKLNYSVYLEQMRTCIINKIRLTSVKLILILSTIIDIGINWAPKFHKSLKFKIKRDWKSIYLYIFALGCFSV